ncbi:hypothetical protein BDK51DRAFT_25997 [Blyttiomyces helicus]|uniref:Uncharacterized protein n=1 Tax=Blyttiomyces helicus TaxID=388810 RepID=A0A4P9WJ77_9FUNG|nr:hypothetical protein BDK51DRAFT_25997 [Blyttiomyces helicus]|eukprot:RKO91983.1 hypothetical protein BDK51DRAFT_25997 [Blyttiomyces helicus]
MEAVQATLDSVMQLACHLESWGLLQGFRIQIKEKEDFHRVSYWIGAWAILHNIMTAATDIGRRHTWRCACARGCPRIRVQSLTSTTNMTICKFFGVGGGRVKNVLQEMRGKYSREGERGHRKVGRKKGNLGQMAEEKECVHVWWWGGPGGEKRAWEVAKAKRRNQA